MSKPVPSAYELYISIGFKDGEFVLAEDGKLPAPATLAADLTADTDGWMIATVYLGSQGHDEIFQPLAGPVAEAAKRMLLESRDFNEWANEYCRGLETSARYDYGRWLNELSDHLAFVNSAA
jgi:hypothetical protein